MPDEPPSRAWYPGWPREPCFDCVDPVRCGPSERVVIPRSVSIYVARIVWAQKAQAHNWVFIPRHRAALLLSPSYRCSTRDRMATGPSSGSSGRCRDGLRRDRPGSLRTVRPSATTSALPVWLGLNGGAKQAGRHPPGPASPSRKRRRRQRVARKAARPACQNASSGIA
jgi:hypothetical protein